MAKKLNRRVPYNQLRPYIHSQLHDARSAAGLEHQVVSTDTENLVTVFLYFSLLKVSLVCPPLNRFHCLCRIKTRSVKKYTSSVKRKLMLHKKNRRLIITKERRREV
ncbi:hypothetical protein Pcinc_014926 [Petrolisthes cinctipes]|uniref:Uncharacterized protein n=1 Tax=Petrolisthes cinctipes TaxID=88211 RepID=A0AAE1FUG5_PETCI|nr:hypothetical protein Pcinc_014926 [Petrolisthes cinctipes]